MKLSVHDILMRSGKIRVNLSDDFLMHLKGIILESNGSLKIFSKKNNIPYKTFQNWLKGNRGIVYQKLNYFCEILGIDLRKHFSDIEYFYCGRKNSKVELKPQIEIDENLFFEGIGLYIGEGQKKKTTNEIALSNTNPNVLKFHLRWLRGLFGVDLAKVTFFIYTPTKEFNSNQLKERWSKLLGIKKESIKNIYYYKKSTMECVLVIYNKAVLRYLIDTILEDSRPKILEKKEYSEAFIRGILAGEGCVCINKNKKVHHVQMGMKDSRDVKLFCDSLKNVGIDFTIKQGNHCIVVTISRKTNIEKLISFGGFGSHDKRNILLNHALTLFSQRQTRRNGAKSFYLGIISGNPGCTSRKLSSLTGRSISRTRAILKHLNKMDLVKRIEVGRYYTYYIKGDKKW